MSNSSFLQFGPEYWEIVDDVFRRLPVRDLIFGCRGACSEWHARIVETRHGQSMLQRRATLISCILQNSVVFKDAYKALFEAENGEIQAEPLQHCISLIWLIYKHWHQQLILQSFRRANLKNTIELEQFLERRLASATQSSDVSNDKNDLIHAETSQQNRLRILEMLQNVQEASHGLQLAVLEDENDGLAEKTYRDIPVQQANEFD